MGKTNISIDFKGLDTYADVYLNDNKILSGNNMFREWEVNCKEFIKEGKNTLRVYLTSPIKIGLEKLKANGYPLPAVNDQSENGGLENKKVSIFTRKAGYHYGWDWGPQLVTSGIWRPVFLKAWNDTKIEDIYIIQNNVSEFSSGDKPLDTDLHYFVKPKDLKLTDPGLNIEVNEETDKYTIEVTSHSLVKNLFLTVDEGDEMFSDNYFDVLPGETKTGYYPKSENIRDFASKLESIHLQMTVK